MADDKAGKNGDLFFSAGEGIDVQTIMDDINSKIEEKISAGVLKPREINSIEELEMQPLPDFQEIPNVYENHLYPETHYGSDFVPEGEGSTPLKRLFKRNLGFFRRKLMPLISYMIRPVTDENRKSLCHLKPVVFQSREYIRILHNGFNNMVTESSKLKIENDLLKTRIQVLEDKIEFVEKRQRAIEKRIFDQ